MSRTLNYGDTISINIAGDPTGSAVTAESGDVARVVFSKRSQPGRKIWRIVSPSDPNATGPVNLADQIHIKTAADDGYLYCDLSGTASISSNPEPKQAAEWGIVSPDSNVTTNEIKFGETGLVLGSWLGRFLSRRAMSETDSRLTVDGAFADETSKWVFNLVPIRRTGAGTLLFNKVNLAAAQIVTKAKTEKAKALAEAHQKAQARLDEARKAAPDPSSLALQKVFVHYGGSDWVGFDTSGGSAARELAEGVHASGRIAIDAGAGRVYWCGYDESQSRFALCSARLDGSDSKQLAWSWTLPKTVVGCVALDLTEGAVFWLFDPGRSVVQLNRTDIATGQTTSVSGIPGFGVNIALDTTNKKVYWSNCVELGAFNYDGQDQQVIFRDGTRSRDPVKLPLNILAVDGKNRCFYGMNICEVWRSSFDQPSRQWVLPPNGNPWEPWRAGPEYMAAAIDTTNRVIYWCDNRSSQPSGYTLMKAPIETYDQSDIGKGPRHAKELFRLESSRFDGTFRVTDVVIVTDALAQATADLNHARVAKPQMIAQAHEDASKKVQDAHTALEEAHPNAQRAIEAKQKEASERRQKAKADADNIHAIAAKKISDANRYDTDLRGSANDEAKRIRNAKQQEADDIKKPAQDKLDAARRKQQDS